MKSKSQARVIGVGIALCGAMFGACDLSYLGPCASCEDGSVIIDGTAGDVSTGVDGGSQDASSTDAITTSDASIDASIDIAPGSACGTIATVQAVPGTKLGQVMVTGGTQTQNITETGGNLLVAIVYSGQGPGSQTVSTAPNMTFHVVDTLGNTYFAGPLIENPKHHQAAIQIFFAPAIKGGANSVTITTMVPGTALPLSTGLLIQEYSGIAASNVVDMSSGQSAASSTETMTPGVMTTLTGCDLVVGAFVDGYVDGQNLNAGSGWVFRSTDDWCPAGAVDDMPSGNPKGTSVNATMELTGGNDDGWVAVQTAFRAATSPSLPSPTGVAFTSAPQTNVSGCSAAVTIQSQRGATPWPSPNGNALALSGNFTFYADSKCAFPITSAYLGAGSTSQSFYFTSAASGTETLTVTPAGLPAVTQNESTL